MTKDELKTRLMQIDFLTIRPLRAQIAGTATQDDLNKLAELEEQAGTIRQQLKELDYAS